MKDVATEEKMIDPIPTQPVEDTTDTNTSSTAVEDASGQSRGVASSGSSDSGTNVNSPNGKAKEIDLKGLKAEPEKPKPKESAGLAGRINTLMSSDINNVVGGRDILMTLLYAPLQLVFGAIFLYQILSWPALVGMLVTAITLPIPAYLSRLLTKSQRILMASTDVRVQAVTEAINSLKMTKLFAWEEKIKERIAEKRELELKAIRRKVFTGVLITTLNFTLPILTMIATYGLYTGVLHRQLTAAQIFSSITIFDIIRQQIFILTSQLTSFIQAKVSVERLNTFLTTTELLDVYEKAQVKSDSNEIFFRNAVFTWGARAYKLKIDDLVIPLGKITLIAGKTSAGKTSLLM